MFLEVPYTDSTAHVLTPITGHMERRHCLMWLTSSYNDRSLGYASSLWYYDDNL